MKKSHWMRILGAFVAAATMVGCSTNHLARTSPIEAGQSAAVDPVAQKKEIENIKAMFSCDLRRYSDIYNYVSAYLRDSNQYKINVLDNLAYRNQLARNMRVADKYISPTYLKKYYISPETSTIEDAYSDIRPPEVLCIQERTQEKYEAFILTYSQSRMDYAVVDTLTIAIEGGEKFLLPIKAPELVSPQASSVYADIGASKVPANAITVSKSVFKQRP
jgi:hypothetical protein